jgi:phosphoglycolate phosphatase
MYKFENYIFDLDGTIINSSEEVLQCFDRAFELANWPIDKNRLTHDVIGPPLREIIKLIAPDVQVSKIDEVEKIFHGLYDNDENDITEFYPGMFELLTGLKNERKRLFLATLKPQKPTERILKQFDLENMFDAVYTIDMFGYDITKEFMMKDIISKFSLNKEETVMIGDAPNDMISAKKSGITALGALWGYGENKEPLKKVSDETVFKVEDLALFYTLQ